MATRINIRLILILAICLLTAGATIGGLWYLQMRGDVSRAVRIGEELFAQGDLEGARDQFRRAVRREPGNPQHLDKLEMTLRAYRPVSADDARTWYGELMAVLRQRSVNFASNDSAHLAFLEELHAVARRTNTPAEWSTLGQQCREMLARLGADHALAPTLRIHEAFAGLRLGQDGLTMPELQTLEAAVDEAAAALGADDRAWAMRLSSKAIMFRRLTQVGQTAAAAAKRRELQGLIAEADTALPAGLDTARAAVVCAVVVQTLDDVAYRAELSGAQAARVERLHANLAAATDAPPWLVIECANVLWEMPFLVDRNVVIDLLGAALSDHERVIDLQYVLARMLYLNGRFDEASDAAEAIVSGQPLPVSHLSVGQSGYRRQAASIMGDVAFVRWESAPPEAKQAPLAALAAARDRLEALASDAGADPYLIRMEGMLAYARGDYDRAAQRFETLVGQFGSTDAQMLVLLSQSLDRIGQPGLALERLAAAHAQMPSNPALSMDKARLEVKVGRIDNAVSTLTELTRIDPSNEQARSMLQVLRQAASAGGAATGGWIEAALRQARDEQTRGDFDAARFTLREALEGSPDQSDLVQALIEIEAAAGQVDAAQALVDERLEKDPNNTRWQLMKASLMTDSPVEALVRFAEQSLTDEAARAETVLSGLTAMLAQQQLVIDRARPAGDLAQVERAAAIMDEAREAARRPIETLERVDADHRALLDHRFMLAVIEKDWPTVERLIAQATAADIDRSGGRFYQARYEIATGRYSQAVRTLQQVTRQRSYASAPWQLLGVAAERSGDPIEALHAYGEAYRCNPTDLAVARRYAAMLMTTGEKTQALEILRGAVRVAPTNVALREQWLALEREVGAEAEVIRFRLRRYDAVPNDRVNVAALARLMGSAEPTRLSVFDDEGGERYSTLAWQQLSAVEQREILNSTRRQWRAASEALLAELAKAGVEAFEVAMIRAEIHQQRDEYDQAATLLGQAVADAGLESMSVEQRLRYAAFLESINRADEALAILRQSLADQDPQTRPVDAALANYHLARSDSAAALGHLRSVGEVSDDPATDYRILDCLIALEQFDEAERMLAGLGRAAEVDEYQATMIGASIDLRKGQVAFARGEADAGRALFRTSREKLARAIQGREGDVQARLQMARSHLAEHRATGDRASLDNVLMVLEEIRRVDAGNSAAEEMRVEVYLARDETGAAAESVAGLLRAAPTNSRYREHLIQLRRRQGSDREALRLAREGVRLAPNSPQWHVMLGDLLLEIDADVPGALAEYEFAFEHAPRPEFLARRLSALMQLDAPDFAAVVSLVEAQSDAVRGHPAVMALHARALSGLGRRDESRELMARSYRTYEEMSAQGIMTPEGLAFWLAQASVLAAGRGPGEVEAVVTELAGATPAPIVLRNLAREHARAGDEVSVDRAIALQQSAIDRSEALSGEARAQMLIELASYCILAGRYAEAASLFEETMSLVPSNMAVVNNFAYLLVEYLGRADDALRHAERAHAMAPADPDALDTLGWVHFKLGNLQQAMNYLETSLRTRESVSAHVHLAAVLLAQGDLDRAAQSLINAQRMRPTEQKQGEIDRLKADIDRQRAAGDPVRPDDG